MSTKDEFVLLLKSTGFSDRVIKSITDRVDSIDDLEDIVSIVESTPHISDKALLNYVDIILNSGKGGKYETIYI